jgi:hypothetical protein
MTGPGWVRGGVVFAGRRAVRAAGLAAALAAASVAAHEEGVIRLASPTAAPGQEIEIEGEKLPRSTKLSLELRGALANYPLGEIESDQAGAFVTLLALPADVRPGRYRVMALAPDGDVVGRADLVVVAGRPAELVPAGPIEPAHVTDAMMDLPVSRSTGEWLAIAALIAGSAVGGFLLLRKAGD